MSYILDSLKKSEKERKILDTPAQAVVAVPEFLENDKPWSLTTQGIILILALMFLIIAVVWWFVSIQQSGQQLPDNTYNNLDTASQLTQTDTSIATGPDTIVASPTPTVTEFVASTPTITKEEAVRLYQEGLTKKSQISIESLYSRIQQQQTSADGVPQEPELTAVTDTLSTDQGQSSVIETSVAETANAPTPATEPLIPSVYQLDSVQKRNIPNIAYGAHVFATDNKSGFVILNGARRRVGDELENGIFVEKISEEEVILSYNGVVFSLPAMKSWLGK